MPSIAKKNGAAQRQLAVRELSRALTRPSLIPEQPLIVEDSIAQTKSIHLVVIWDELRNLSQAERSQIILDAYAVTKPNRKSTVTMAMGLTGDEAVRMGFLPFSIVTTHRRGDKVQPAQLEKAMSEAGGILLKIGSSTQLRFATLEQAENAHRYLSQKFPGPYWAIVHELAAVE